MKSPKIYRVLVYTKKVFQGGGLFDLCRRRRNRLETCLKKQRNVDKKTLCFTDVEMKKTLHRTSTRFFFKYLYVRVLLIDGREAQKTLDHSTRQNKSNNMEPHFPTSATKSRSLEDTKTAVALPHCSKSTWDSIAGWWSFLLEVMPDIWRKYGTSYVKKTEVEVLPVVDLSGKSVFQTVFCGRCNTGGMRVALSPTRIYQVFPNQTRLPYMVCLNPVPQPPRSPTINLTPQLALITGLLGLLWQLARWNV